MVIPPEQKKFHDYEYRFSLKIGKTHAHENDQVSKFLKPINISRLLNLLQNSFQNL